MQKSIKLAFLGLILTFVAAPTVCKPQNKTAQVNKKQQSFFSKVASNKYAKVALGLSFAGIGSTASLAVPCWHSFVNLVDNSPYPYGPKLISFGSLSLPIKSKIASTWIMGLVGTYLSVKGGCKVATS